MASNHRLRITQFNQELLKAVKDIRKDLANKTVDVAVLTAQRITERTPWKTGTARQNWNPSIDNPDLTVHPKAIYAGLEGLAPSETAGQTARARAEAVFGGLRASGEVRKLYLSNALEYIALLDSGQGSAQAPQPFVEATIFEIESEIAGEN